MRLVVIESPYAGDIAMNTAYARACLRDSLLRGEAPLASHLLYTQANVLRDHVLAERQLGIAAGLAWGAVADATVLYIDHGITAGMRQGWKHAEDNGRIIERRVLR